VRAAAAVFVFLLALTGMAGAAGVTGQPVDAAAAAKIISQYRASHGLPAVKIEPRLMKIASTHAQRMASTDRLEHVLPGEGSFPQRINAGGYQASVAAENIGAGYGTLSEAIQAWETSPAHNANLLQRNVTEIGIALYSTPVGVYHTYWALVLAHPAASAEGSVGGGPGGGISIGPFGFTFGN
jgi:uncharacterized protein YkwD